MGRYLAGVLGAVVDLPAPPDLILVLFSLAGAVANPPPRARPAPRRLPARVLNRLWARVPFPPAELLSGRVDVFHGGNFVLPPLAKAAGVVTVHDLAFLKHSDTVDSQVRAYGRLVPASLARARRVITVSEAVRAEVCEEYGLDPERVVVAHNGVDPEWAQALPPDAGLRARLGLPERYLLFVGNREPRKGLDLLVRAHEAARRADSQVPVLALAGPSGWGDVWKGHEPGPDVLLLGFLPDQQLRAVVAGAVALCQPSRYEGFGLPVLEALACGRPVLASDIPALREVGGDHVSYAGPGDADGWSHLLVQVAAASTDSTSEAARRAHASRFTWVQSALTHAETWRAAAAEGRPGRT